MRSALTRPAAGAQHQQRRQATIVRPWADKPRVGTRHGRASAPQKQAGRQGVSLQDWPSGPGLTAAHTQGSAAAAADSQSPGGPRADKPRVGWVTWRAAPRIQTAGKHSAPPGPAAWAHTRGGGRQSKSRRTTGRQAKGRPGASVSGLAGGQGVPLTGRPSGPTPGATAGSQSPGGPRADKPRVGWVTGRASARSWPAGKECPTRTGRQGPHPGRGGRQSEPDQQPTSHRPGLAHARTRAVVRGHTAGRD